MKLPPKVPKSEVLHPECTDEQIGERIRIAREALGITQGYLARIMGMSRPVISLIEIGARKLTATELIPIAIKLNVKPMFLLRGSKP